VEVDRALGEEVPVQLVEADKALVEEVQLMEADWTQAGSNHGQEEAQLAEADWTAEEEAQLVHHHLILDSLRTQAQLLGLFLSDFSHLDP